MDDCTEQQMLAPGVSDQELDRLERRAFRTRGDTGFDEISEGLGFLAFASFGLVLQIGRSLPQKVADQVVMVGLSLVLLASLFAWVHVDSLKKRETVGRLGTFKPGAARRRRQRLGTILPFALVFSAGLVVLWLVGWGEARDDGFNYLVFGIMVVVGGTVGLVEAHYTERPRQRALGWLFGVAWGAAFAGGFLSSPAIVAFALAGAVHLAVGIVVLRRFRRENPILPKCDDCDG